MFLTGCRTVRKALAFFPISRSRFLLRWLVLIYSLWPLKWVRNWRRKKNDKKQTNNKTLWHLLNSCSQSALIDLPDLVEATVTAVAKLVLSKMEPTVKFKKKKKVLGTCAEFIINYLNVHYIFLPHGGEQTAHPKCRHHKLNMKWLRPSLYRDP